MRTSNPVLSESIFRSESEQLFPNQRNASKPGMMTINGTVIKTGFLFILLLITAGFSWYQTRPAIDGGTPSNWMIYVMIGGIGGLITALITSFYPKASPITAPLYAGLEGLVLGAVSAIFEGAYQGIVLQAVALTLGVFIVMLLTYVTRLIQATETFKRIIVCATGAICLVYLATFILSFFNINIPYIHSSGPIGIAFSIFVVAIASFNLILDFDFIEQGASMGMPKYMEWYGGFGLMVTLVWLYLEILRLLAKLRSQRD